MLKTIRAGRNPRTFFDPAEHASLVESIRAHGVMQPILVRPVDDGYQLVAGERRYRAAMEAHGEDYEMPVVVKDLDDAHDRHDVKMSLVIGNCDRPNPSIAVRLCAKGIFEETERAPLTWYQAVRVPEAV